MRVLATPGHTYTHLSYVLEEHGAATAVFSGGSLLFGSTGRPDLLGPDHTHDLVHHQYASAQRLAAELPDRTRVMPTHGFGSFCSATQSEATASTIGAEKATQSGAHPGRAALRHRASRRAWTPSRPTTRRWARPTPAGPRRRT